MLFNILKPIILLLFSFFVFYFYYFQFNHFESFSCSYLYYFLIVGIILVIYNFYLFFTEQKKVKLPIYYPIGFFIFSLFVLCFQFFSLNNLELSNGFTLFFKVIGYSFIPIFILFITTSFGKKITKYLPKIDNFSSVFRFILSLNLGFISFITLVILGSFLGLYNIYFIIFLLFLFSGISYKEIIENAKGLYEYKLDIHIKEGFYLKFLSSQVLFTIFSLVLGVALISIFRPFPIGWDDLGVYMNYPNQLAQSGSMISFGAMYSWQFFTGIGYMFGSPTFAFFFNISGTFLSFIVLNLVISEFLNKYIKKENEKSFVSLPLLLSTFFVSLPMVVFQTSKDMKLDLGLFFISISAIYLLFSYILHIKNTESGKLKTDYGNLIYLFIIGVLVGFAFSVKFTSLLLIISVLALIFYFRLGLLGFFSFFSIFIGIFTYTNLWKMMNVVINPNNIVGLETKLGVSFLAFGIILFVVQVFIGDKNILSKKSLKESSKSEEKIEKTKKIIVFLKEIGVFLLGVFIILLPWFGKNIAETYPNVSISGILGGKAERYDFGKNLENMYSQKELESIKKYWKEKREKENSITTNEDLNRYIGYESGVLNYVNLPWNLTMQKNQGGEFTDISFVFLALLPLIFIFLNFRNKYFHLFFIILFFGFIFFTLLPNQKLIENKKIENFGDENIKMLFKKENKFFNKSIFRKDIYDINLFRYINKQEAIISIKNKKDFQDNLKRNTYFRIKIEIDKLKQKEKDKPKYDELNKYKKYGIKLNKELKKLDQELEENIKEIKKLEREIEKNITANTISVIAGVNLEKKLIDVKTIIKSEEDKLLDNYIKNIKKQFYNEIVSKILYNKLEKQITILNNTSFNKIDYNLIKNISFIFNSYVIFSSKDIVSLEKQIQNLDKKEQAKILNLWKENRTIKGKIIDTLAKISIPYAYLFIFVLFLLPFLYLIFTLKNTKNNYLFTLNLVFTFIYTFLWTISAFGIVWYGISMYFGFMLMIAFSAYNFIYYNEKEEENLSINLKIFSSIILFIIIGSYLVTSVIPHSFSNLKKTSYSKYKSGDIKYPNSIFDANREKINILFNLNIKETEKENFIRQNLPKIIKERLPKNTNVFQKLYNENIFQVLYHLQDVKKEIEKEIIMEKDIQRLSMKKQALKDVEKSIKNIYFGIINPSEKYRSQDNIYRAGTFLRYYITDNTKRLLEDSLLFSFNDYIYDENPDVTISRLKKLGMKYMVVDLNAATIDKSKTHDLTKRYEKMLKTFTSDKLELISTNSICLMVGLENYKKDKDLIKFINISGVNYESYDEKDNVISRNTKLTYCANFILDLLKSNSINQNNYSFLKGFIGSKTSQEIANKIGKSNQAIFKIK